VGNGDLLSNGEHFVTLETVLTKVQKLNVVVLAGILVVVVILSTIHLGVLVGEEIESRACWKSLVTSCWC
jgi:hypothetical protein